MEYRDLRPEDFDYDLPPELIAQTPLAERDQARLLVVRRGADSFEHRRVADLPGLLREGDLLVLNETRVLKARLQLAREATGGAVEVFLLAPLDGESWLALGRPLKRLRQGEMLVHPLTGEPLVELLDRLHLPEELPGGAALQAEEAGPGKYLRVRGVGRSLLEVAAQVGQVPLPPYIKRPAGGPSEADEQRYQTVFGRVTGSVAAPTAGLHLTPAVLAGLEAAGVGITRVVLHVGWGTFAPLTAAHFQQGRLHHERYEVAATELHRLREGLAAGRRIIPVGTTSLRTLETLAAQQPPFSSGEGSTDIFIAPGYRFQAAGGLLTNFHLPKSSLFALVCALLGPELARKAYAEAIRERYRFFSYGDAMLVV